MLGSEEWAYVLNIENDEPLQLPSGYIPIGVAMTPIQYLPDAASLSWYYVDAPVDAGNANQLSGTSWNGSDINQKTYYEEDQQMTGLDYLGYNWIAFQNDDFPDPIDSGVIKVVIEYI